MAHAREPGDQIGERLRFRGCERGVFRFALTILYKERAKRLHANHIPGFKEEGVAGEAFKRLRDLGYRFPLPEAHTLSELS